MHPLRLQTMASVQGPATEPTAHQDAAAGRPRRLGQVGKGFAAFVVGLLIGATTIILADLAVPGPRDTGALLDDGPVQLRR